MLSTIAKYSQYKGLLIHEAQQGIDNFVARSTDRLEIPHQTGYIALENCCLVQSGSHVNKELSKMKEERVKLLNVFVLGLCFCLVFTGFITVGQTQVTRFGEATYLKAL